MNIANTLAPQTNIEGRGNDSAAPQIDSSAFLTSLANKLESNSNPEEVSKVRALGETPSVPESEELRKAFQDFVGQTLFSQMIASMRTTQGEVAYFNGGRAEKIFQGQLDQMLSEELSNASASKISDPMFKLFQLRRQ
jgi:peptidoglycan hydrolase FlgJ